MTNERFKQVEQISAITDMVEAFDLKKITLGEAIDLKTVIVAKIKEIKANRE